jgi:hypothetical protein
MRVRRLIDGDLMLGHGLKDYIIDTPEAVSQRLYTRLNLWRGEWFLDTSQGTPWNDEVLGKSSIYDAILEIKNVILETEGVKEITDFSHAFNGTKRALSFYAKVDTIYGILELEG